MSIETIFLEKLHSTKPMVTLWKHKSSELQTVTISDSSTDGGKQASAVQRPDDKFTDNKDIFQLHLGSAPFNMFFVHINLPSWLHVRSTVL